MSQDTMAPKIDPQRLRTLRERKGWTQKQLAQKAKLDQQTVYRNEAGQSTRPSTLDKLANALDIDRDVLTGTRPLPPPEQPSEQQRSTLEYAVGSRVDGAIRNAFTLVARRYNIQIARIIELAPLLFALAAEESLARRRERLRELNERLEAVESLRKNFRHLPESVAPTFEADDALGEEQRLIDARDIFGLQISDGVFERFGPIAGEDFDFSMDNPFAVYLTEAARTYPNVMLAISAAPNEVPSYRVCLEEIRELVGGDEELAEEVFLGWVAVHEMQAKGLLAPDMKERRIQWIRERAKSVQEEIDQSGLETFLEFDELSTTTSDGEKS